MTRVLISLGFVFIQRQTNKCSWATEKYFLEHRTDYILRHFFQAVQIHRECSVLCEGRNLRAFVIDKVNKAPKKLATGLYDIIVTTPNRSTSLNCKFGSKYFAYLRQ